MPKKKAKKKAAKSTKAPGRKAAKKPAGRAKPAKRAKSKPAKKAVAKKAVAKKAVAKKAVAKKAVAKKAVAKKAVAKKAVAKKAVAKKAVAKPGVARAMPVQRRDHAGHIDPKYGAELLEKGSHDDATTDSFINRPRSGDALVEELGEEFVEGATSAEHPAEEALNQDVSEDVGGPFVESGGGTEFAPGTDASNPSSATREPFPRT